MQRVKLKVLYKKQSQINVKKPNKSVKNYFEEENNDQSITIVLLSYLSKFSVHGI